MHPVRVSLDVRSAPPPCEQVEMEERVFVRVEDARPLLDDAGPGPHASEHVGEVVEQLGWTMGHESVYPPSARRARRSGFAGARHFLCSERICGVSTCSHLVCITRSIQSSNAVSEASAMCLASRRMSARAA